MLLYLVHHGDAASPDVEPQRPLTMRGRSNAEGLAREAAGRGARPAGIWHSGKLRARQTAEVFRQACNPLAELAAVRGLQPSDPPQMARELLTEEARDVMLVGHMPNLPLVLQCLLGRDQGAPEFPLHGMVALEREGGRFIERWRLGEGGCMLGALR